MNEIKLNNSKVLYNKKIYEKYDIVFEVYRGIKYCILLQNFIILCTTYLPKNIFTNKKSSHRTLTNLYSTWFFSLYSTYDFNNDTFFPSNYTNNTILKDILLDYCSLDNSIINKEEIINIILTKNTINYKISLDIINKYKTNNFFNNNINNYTISKYKTFEKRNDEEITFYKFNLKFTFNFNINNYRLQNILTNIIIPEVTYNKMKNNYNGFPDEIDIYIFIILFRYQLLGSNNHQLSILPKVMRQIKSDFNTEIECFASSINSETKYFCSIYYDVEKYFGSIGSFFQNTFISGVYTFNPPYQKDIIEQSINKILNLMKSNKKLAFFITIPIWDNEGKQIMKELNMENNNDNIKYSDFTIIDKMKTSKYFYGLRMISKNDFTYLDHNFYLFKNKTIQNTYIIILANYKNKYIDKINKYNFYD